MGLDLFYILTLKENTINIISSECINMYLGRKNISYKNRNSYKVQVCITRKSTLIPIKTDMYNISLELTSHPDYICWYPSLLEFPCLHLTSVARPYTRAELPMMQPHSTTAIPLCLLERSMAYLGLIIMMMIMMIMI